MANVDKDVDLAVLLRISNSWSPDISDDELYLATRGYWRMSAEKATRVVQAVAVAQGVVRAVFDVHAWRPAPSRGAEGRLVFDGTPATRSADWVGTDVSSIFSPGSQNPVRYVLAADLDRVLTSRRPRRVGDDDLAAMVAVQEPTVAEQVTPIVDAFESDVVWHMARGDLESFHSNLLGFLMSTYPDAAAPLRRLFTPAPSGGKLMVWREWRHIDVVAEGRGGSDRFVIEIKIYSIPHPGQLEALASAPLPWSADHGAQGAPDTSYWLLTLMEPTFLLPAPWRRVRLDDVALALEAIALDLLGSDAELFDRYRAFVRRLVELRDAIDPRNQLDGPFWVATALGDSVPRRWLGPLQKMRYAGLAHAIDREHGGHVTLKINLTRGTGLMTHLRPLASNINRSVGWQLQGDQLRLVALVQDRGFLGRSTEHRARRASIVENEYLNWFDFHAAQETLGDLLIPKEWGPGQWNHYYPDFVYRYRKIKPGTTTRQLATAMAEITARTDTWAQAH
ncbi:hypothetical protein [Promicromonospora soli]